MLNVADREPVAARGRWMALIAALLGWMFDGFEIGMFPLVGPNALDELLRDEIAVNPAIKSAWFGAIMSVFLVGAATGGVLFGWLGDRIGRVRAMSLSILTYALFTGLCGLATEAWHIAVLRFIASLGMGGEWALGVSLVTELWPDRSRALIAGLIGAAANVGLLAVGLLSLVLLNLLESIEALLLAAGVRNEIVAALLYGDGWRILMIAGAAPAALIFFIRLFVPESPKWQAARAQGATSHWAAHDLLGVGVGAVVAAGLILLWSPIGDEFFADGETGGALPLRGFLTLGGLAAALVGYMYPVGRYLTRAAGSGSLKPGKRSTYLGRMALGAALAGIPLLGTWGALQWAPKWSIALAAQLPTDGGPYFAKEYTHIASSAGAILGSFIAALVAGALGRRITYVLLCIGSFAALASMYQVNDAFGPMLLVSVFVAGAFTAAFYGWLPLYLPELFPTSIRATCQGFAYNFGRVLSAVGSMQTVVLTAYFARGLSAERIEIEAFPRAGATLAGIYLIGAIVIWLGPETRGRQLPD